MARKKYSGYLKMISEGILEEGYRPTGTVDPKNPPKEGSAVKESSAVPGRTSSFRPPPQLSKKSDQK